MNLKTISLITSIIGISLLLLLSLFVEPKLSTISELRSKQIYQKVKIQGQLISQKAISPSFGILKIKDLTGTIEVLLNKNIQIKDNSTLEITGKISEYKENKQITADKILLKN